MEGPGEERSFSHGYESAIPTAPQVLWSVVPILKGEGVVFTDNAIKKDECFESLIVPSPFWDTMTTQVLELMFGSFVIVTKRMFSDHPEGGKHDKPSK